MIVRGKQRPTAQSRIIVDVLEHRLCYRPTVVRARAASHLIQDDKAARRGAAQDMSRLHHLHHERALSTRQIVLSTDPGENAISDSDTRISGRNERANLSQNRGNGHLAKKGALASHVGARHEHDASTLIVQY